MLGVLKTIFCQSETKPEKYSTTQRDPGHATNERPSLCEFTHTRSFYSPPRSYPEMSDAIKAKQVRIPMQVQSKSLMYFLAREKKCLGIDRFSFLRPHVWVWHERYSVSLLYSLASSLLFFLGVAHYSHPTWRSHYSEQERFAAARHFDDNAFLHASAEKCVRCVCMDRWR